MIVKGRDMTTGLPKTVTIYTNEIYHCLKEMLDTIGEEARLVLEATPPELAGDIIERGVMVTGAEHSSKESTVCFLRSYKFL